MIEGLSHITLIVRDLQRMSAILSQVLDGREIYSSGDDTFSVSREKFFIVGGQWIAVMEGASARVIPNLDGARATPTLVAFGEDGEPRVGEAARRQAIQDPRASVVAVLRLLGRTLDAC